MDEAVLRGLARWPHVPACYGWLALDRRGRWRMRDEAAQRNGLAGDVVQHPVLNAYIGRNYVGGDDGAWYFQNGPQRVYVDLEVAPLIFFLNDSARDITTHHGHRVHEVRRVLIDDDGNAWLDTDLGPGLVCDRDLDRLLDRIAPLDASVDAAHTTWTYDRLLDAPHTFAAQLPQAGTPLALQRICASDAPTHLKFVQEPRMRAS